MTYTHEWIAVIVTAIGSFVIGFMWFGPIFGKTWIKLMNFDPAKMEEAKKQSMAKPMTLAFISNIISAFVFLSVAAGLSISGFGSALILAILLWLGFAVPIFLNTVLWEGKAWSLFWLSSTHILATLVFSALVYVWLVA